MPSFVPGLELSRRFYAEVVRPLLADHFPHIAYAAALIGPGSEVLGFDTEMSTDHDWGPRVFIFLNDEDIDQAKAIRELLSYRLPRDFSGYSTHLGDSPADPGTRVMMRTMHGPIRHRVIPMALSDFLRMQLGYDDEQPFRALIGYPFPLKHCANLHSVLFFMMILVS